MTTLITAAKETRKTKGLCNNYQEGGGGGILK